jgi:hypothetical protein
MLPNGNRCHLVSFIVGTLLFLLPVVAPAQTQTGTITGVLSDEQGAVLPGATVTIESEALIVPQTTTTNERGIYTFISLPPGQYTIKFEMMGFGTVTRPGVVVNVARTTSVDHTMQLASVQESITVTAESPAVDTKSNSIGTNFDNSLLENIPQAREIWSTVEQVPGATMSKFNVGGSESAQQSSMMIHGSMPGQQEYAIEGLKLNWPGGNGGATAFYFDHDSFSEINIMTNGAPAEVGTGGVYMNMVTKSGGNKLQGGTSFFYEDDSFQGDNVSDELREQGVSNGNPLNYLFDFNAHIGGPIIQDKAWFFSSYRRYDIDRDVLGITRADGTPATDVNHQTNVIGKVTTQINEANKLMFNFNFNYQNRFYRRPTSDLVSEEASWRQIEPAYIVQGQWTSLISEKLFLDVRYGYLNLVFPLRYQDSVGPDDFSRQDVNLLTLRDAAIYDYENVATRNQGNGSLTYFVDDWAGTHNLKTGFEWGRAFNQNEYNANGNYVLRYFRGEPFEVQTYNTPLVSKNYIDTISFYVQDSWVVNRKLSVNYGFRFEHLNGYAPNQGRDGNQFFSAEEFDKVDNIPLWNDGAWRVGVNYDVSGDGKTSIRGYVGRFQLQEGTRLVQQVNANDLGGDYRSWDDLNGDNSAQLEELGPSTRPYGGRVNRIDENIKRPYSDEFNIGFDRELAPNVAFGVTYFRRHNRRLLSGINVAVPPSSYEEVQVESTAGLVTAYNQDPETLGLADRVITNQDGLENNYNGVEIRFDKRMDDHWQLLASLSIGSTEGTYDRGLGDDFNDPNLNINRNNAKIDKDSTYAGKIIGTYVFPHEITASTNFRYTTGQPALENIQIRDLNQGLVTILQNPRGNTRLDNVTLWDVRLSKVFRWGQTMSFEAMFDVFNLLNQASKTVINQNVGPTFGNPIAILPPRVVRLGVVFRF